MKEIFVVMYTNFLGMQSCEVQAEEIDIVEDGVKLYDGERCIAYFSDTIFRAVYRKIPEGREPFLAEEKKDK